MPNRSDYQPLAQSADTNDAVPTTPQRSSRRGLKRALRPGPIDLSKLDAAFKRWVVHERNATESDVVSSRWTENITQKVKGKKKAEPDDSRKEILRSVFDPPVPPHPIHNVGQVSYAPDIL